MSGSRHDWLDEETAERLLRGEPVDPGTGPAAPRTAGWTQAESRPVDGETELTAAAAPGTAGPGAFGEPAAALAGLLSAAAGAAVSQRREDDAVAAFRAARERTGARPAAAHTRWRRLRALPGSAKVAVAAAFAATALVGGVAAAAGTGVIPYPFSTTGSDPAPEPSGGSDRPALDGTAVPSAPVSKGAAPTNRSASGSPSATPSGASAAPGAGAPSAPGTPAASGGTGDGVQDPDTLCREYLAARSGNGDDQRKLAQWLARVAGGDKGVDTYCRQRLGLGGSGGSGGASGGDGSASGGKGDGKGSGHGSGGGESGGGDGSDGGGSHKRGPLTARFGPLSATLAPSAAR